MTKIIEADHVPDLLRPGMTVFCAGGMSHPDAIVRAINRAPGKTRDVHFIVTRAPGFAEPWLRAPEGRITTFFGDRAIDGEPEFELVPMQYRRIYDFLQKTAIDLALAQLAPANGVGEYKSGLGVDFFPAVLGNAKEVVAESNQALPSLGGAPSVDGDRLDYVVLSSRSPATLSAPPSPEAEAIGRQVAELIADGDCLQTGLGAIPDAVLAALGEKNDLGFHSGMASDGVVDLVEAGVLTGVRKSRDQGLIVTGFLLGSERLYGWAQGTDRLLLRPVSYTHDSAVISSLDHFVSINSAVEVDLLGQVNAERAGGRQISGTGGSVDFCRGAACSTGGRSIVAMPSTAVRGKVSRIVRHLSEPAVATLTRTDVDFVVTEHGVAELRGCDQRRRAERLISIAAPEHREPLRVR